MTYTEDIEVRCLCDILAACVVGVSPAITGVTMTPIAQVKTKLLQSTSTDSVCVNFTGPAVTLWNLIDTMITVAEAQQAAQRVGCGLPPVVLYVPEQKACCAHALLTGFHKGTTTRAELETIVDQINAITRTPIP